MTQGTEVRLGPFSILLIRLLSSMQTFTALRARVLHAHTHGYKVAYLEEYIVEFGGTTAPPSGILPNTTEHLLYILDRLEKGIDLEPITAKTPTNPPPPVQPIPEAPTEAPSEEPTAETPSAAPTDPTLEAPRGPGRRKKQS
jgi:hypothetical protein